LKHDSWVAAAVAVSISRCAAKPIISHRTSVSAPFSSMLRNDIVSSVMVVTPGQGLLW
jgi:hypothetical protein